jgi:hypothetical protein
MEPTNHHSYSNGYRPDATAYSQGWESAHLVMDIKVGNPHSSNPDDTGRRGAAVGFGNTKPDLVAKMFGQLQRGLEGDGQFNPATGAGYVKPTEGDYAHAIATGQDVRMILFETFGGFGRDTMRVLKKVKAVVSNKLATHQYNDASWSTRNWMSYQCQKLSVKLHIAVAWEIGAELGLPTCTGTDPRHDGAEDAGA